MAKAKQTPDSDLPAELAAPAVRALTGAGYTKLEQLTKVTESEIKDLHGIGKNALKQLQAALQARGLSFAMPESDFPIKQMGNPAYSALTHIGYFRLEQLTKLTEKELLKIHGVGPKAVAILRDALAAKGLSFAE